MLGALTSNIEHGDQQAQQPPLPKHFLQVLAPGPGPHCHPLPHLVAGLPPEDQQQLMAAEAGAGQADGKPEVEHEDDEHFRTEDSSCRGRGDTRVALHPGHVRSCKHRRRFPLGREGD